MTTIETQGQLTDLLRGVKMLGTRFQEWEFDWTITQVETASVVVDIETVGLHPVAEMEEPMAALMPATTVVGWHIQSSFERPDANGGVTGLGYGRKWYVEVGTSAEGAVFTAWLAVQQIVTHELHEAFTVEVDGERVRLLDPHKSLSDLAVGSRRV